MDRKRLPVAALLAVLLLHNRVITESSAQSVYHLLHDFIRYNVAGPPVVHQETYWNFDPNAGKQGRAKYEQENGRFGKIAIAKVGMGIRYREPSDTRDFAHRQTSH